MSTAPTSHPVPSDDPGPSSESLDVERSIEYDEFGVEYINDSVDPQQMNGSVAYNMEIRDGSGSLIGHPNDLESFEDTLGIHGQYYVMDDNIMTDGSMIPISGESRFLLNTEVGNISVTREDLISVGVNVTDPININVSSVQSDALLLMCQERGDVIQPEYGEFEIMNDMVYPPPLKAEDHDSEVFYQSPTPGPSTSSIGNGHNKSDELYAYITDEGSLALMGKNGRCVATYHRDDLREMGVSDATALNEAEMQQLIQNLSNNGAVNYLSYSAGPSTPGSYQPPSTPQPKIQQPSHPPLKNSSQINGHVGEVVDVTKGRFGPREAVIRYFRTNGTYKVQFDDGHFEWVKESEIQRKMKNKTTVEKVTIQPGQKRPRILKAETPTGFHPSTGPIEKPTLIHANSGFCALCDKKIPNARPAFIVIRIPACRCCAENKALLVEDIIGPAAKRSRQPSTSKDGERTRTVSESTLVMLKEPKTVKIVKTASTDECEVTEPPPDLEPN